MKYVQVLMVASLALLSWAESNTREYLPPTDIVVPPPLPQPRTFLHYPSHGHHHQQYYGNNYQQQQQYYPNRPISYPNYYPGGYYQQNYGNVQPGPGFQLGIGAGVEVGGYYDHGGYGGGVGYFGKPGYSPRAVLVNDIGGGASSVISTDHGYVYGKKK